MSVGHGTIDGVTSTASTVERAFRAALYDDTDTGLDTGASLLAADSSADAELTRRGEEFVASAWQRGWQPADVIRLVRRELAEAHVCLAAALIRAQAGRDRARGHRWNSQLAGLPEAPARDADRFSRATTALELYRLLLRLPALEPLQDEPRRAAGPQASRMLARIRALLAKAEATGYPEEAEALSAKAQELMARHSVDEALLAAEAPAPDAPGACRIGVEPPYEQAKAVLLDAVAGANHCRAVWNETLGFSTVVGFEADLETVELLYTSLLVQATHAMAGAEAAQRAGGRKRTKTFRQSFLAAYAHRVGDRLAAVAESQVSQDLLPVLATREIAVTDRMERMFPQTTTTRLRGVSDAAGWTEGARAADQAQVRSRPRLG
ncbi:aromatic acid decarboxylase [Streptomyces sp. MUSC 14]|nr:aromatic acid decarboxylase [Streptomyces sp. MUSC 14]